MYYRCQKLTKRYGPKEVLKIEDLSLPLGQTTVIMGPNGAGKTTLLRILSFLDYDYHGMLFLGDRQVPKSVEGTTQLRQSSAVIRQRPVMFNMSVYENVALGLKLRGLRGAKVRHEVEAALDRLGLTNFAGVSAKKLSGGEMQKVSVARALVLNPEIIFVDEPSSNLDIEAIDLLHSLLQEEKAKGKTIVVITHNFAEARVLGDYGVFLNKGGVLAAGAFPDILTDRRLEESSYWRYL